jgi:TM2 domain-containing membrane protein YozV
MYRLIGSDGRQYGPASAEDIRRWITENRLNAQTIAHLEGAQEWKPLSAFPEFALDFKIPAGSTAPPPLQTPQAAPSNPRASTKIAAGIFGLLLGCLGIHKFILGFTGAGLIMLLVTLLTCGVAGPLIHLIGMIEGIIYLTKSDSEFVRLYVEGRRDWF